MNLLTIIGNQTTSPNENAELAAVEQAVNALHTPLSYWIVIIIGLVASRWLVRPPEKEVQKNDDAVFLASACLFVVALLSYLHIRNQFIPIYVDLIGRSDALLTMPMLLGSSPIGAVLLILSWYYVHPIARRQVGPSTGIKTILNSFAPMVLLFIFIGALITMGLFLRLV